MKIWQHLATFSFTRFVNVFRQPRTWGSPRRVNGSQSRRWRHLDGDPPAPKGNIARSLVGGGRGSLPPSSRSRTDLKRGPTTKCAAISLRGQPSMEMTHRVDFEINYLVQMNSVLFIANRCENETIN